ncbi:ribosomal protein S6 kinase-like 1 [Clytia hemisphaerica]|uniref:Ribosomal protein S6 kinase delta-1 n=1 Tax=Clytia hemisphaerica TaxID=252671 RepID=A0A7M5X5V3_9CNID
MEAISNALKEKKQIGFDVTDPMRSFAGYTVYRLHLKIFTSPEECTSQFIGWKRFNDFKHLHKTMKTVFPKEFNTGYNEFIKGNFFGRFDEAVIEERRKAAIRLLSFITLYSEMLEHQVFLHFLNNNETGHKSSSDDSPRMHEDSMSSDSIDCGNLCDEEDGVISTDDVLDASIQQMTVVEDGEEPEAPDDEVFLNVENSGSSFEDDDGGRHTWLREARSLCGDDLESLASEAADDFPITPRLSDDRNNSVLLGDPLDDDIICQQQQQIPTQDITNNNNTDITPNSTEPSEISEESPPSNINDFHEKLQVDEKMSAMITKTVEEDDYVFQASVAMSNAIEQEELGNVEAAFDMYKFGIGLLLRGAQTDKNTDRIEAVRRKTAQYLLRAETLYKLCFKDKEELKEVKKDEKTIPTDSMSLDSKWKFRLSDVKVIGVIDKVMLVQKVFSKEDDVFIMKVLHKQGAEYKRTVSNKKANKSKRNLYNCRFMTALVNCVETKTGVYLLLEHVHGGRLWDLLGLQIFTNRRKSSHHSSMTDTTHHSLNSSTSHHDANNENIDIVDIPASNYVQQGSGAFPSRLRGVSSSSVTCKIKRSPSKSSSLDESEVQVWAAQIALALMDLHSKGVLCRDLNPRNILVDTNGNIKLTYFSQVDGIDYSLDDNAAQCLYTSPEVDGVFEPTSSTDWWSYGAILFELLTGEALYSCHPNGISRRSVITLPRRVSNEACALLAGLLKYDSKERLGSGPTGNEEIKAHPFFHGIDWESLKKNSQQKFS